jgi:hypothetical protein
LDFAAAISGRQKEMKNRSTFAIVCSVAVFLLGALAVFLVVWLSTDTTFEFRVQDAVSKKWVWDLTAQLQGREIRAFYQSDAAPSLLRLSHLKPGRATIALAAPAYKPASISLVLRRGANFLKAPVDMIGLEIPNLSRFVLFESLDGSDIVTQIRPVGTDGKVILNHPCMNLWIGCQVYVQTKRGVPVLEDTESGSERGEELFRGPIPWQWDSAPETVFRYSARIPGVEIKDHPSLYRVIDYLIVVPDPNKIGRKELEALMSRLFELSDPATLTKALDAVKGRLRYFMNTSWNVKAR